MRGIFRTFFYMPGTRPVLVAICLIVAGFAEAIGIGTFLPVISSLSSEPDDNAFTRALHGVFQFAGITPTPVNFIIAAVAAMLFKSTATFGALAYAGRTAAHVAIDFRRRLVEALFAARWSLFTSQQSGRVASVISADAGRAGEAYQFAAQVVAKSFLAVAYCVIALMIDWRMTIIGVSASVVLAFALRELIQASKRAGRKQSDRTSDITTAIVDTHANIKPMKSMQRYDAKLTAINALLVRLRKALITRELARAGITEAGDALLALFAGAGLLAAMHFSSLTLAELVISAVIALQIVNVVTKLQRLMQQFALVDGSLARTEELVQHIESSREPHEGRMPPPEAGTIVFDDVSFSHDQNKVISNASFEIKPNRITVFSGGSGAGKTTLVDLLMYLHRPDSGEIRIDNVALKDVDITQWRRLIGYVPQELNLFHTSVRDNITLGDTTIPEAAVHEALWRAGAADFIAQLPHGLDTDVGELGAKFSGGQRQRISLARALVGNPTILILDEVTSALDPHTEKGIVDNIKALAKNYTTIVITHRPAWTKIASAHFLVKNGRVEKQRVQR